MSLVVRQGASCVAPLRISVCRLGIRRSAVQTCSRALARCSSRPSIGIHTSSKHLISLTIFVFLKSSWCRPPLPQARFMRDYPSMHFGWSDRDSGSGF